MAIGTPGRVGAWRESLTRAAIWRRGLAVGLCVGAVQVAVNQGDVWLRGAADPGVLLKTVLSPLITIGVAVTSAAWTEVERRQYRRTHPNDPG